MKKLVQFGAGKIGRSFIGQLFSVSGYEVVFIDIFKPVIEELNKRHRYKVIIKGQRHKTISVSNVRGVWADNTQEVISEVACSDIIATSVGNNALPGVLPLIAQGLNKRYEGDPNLPLDIIIAENMRNAAEYFRTELKKRMLAEYPFDKLVGLVETSIGKMVPLTSKKDMEQDCLQVFAEAYNTLILDKKGFKNPIPEVPGLSPKENMKAWVDRKSFIHNLGHAAASYAGYVHNSGFVYMYEVLEVEQLYSLVRGTMIQSSRILLKEYPDEFTEHDLTVHIDDLLERFMNRALGDTVYRVGRDVQRKLGPEDRLCGAIRMGLKHGMPVDDIVYALVCGFFFRAKDEEGNMLPRDRKFVSDYFDKGARYMLTYVCGFEEDKDKEVIEKAEKYFEDINNRGFPCTH